MNALFTTLCLSLPALPDGAELRDRWVYCPVNLQVDANVDRLEGIMRRAAKAGYNGILITDSKFSRLDSVIPRYFRNLARVRRLGAELKLRIIPALFPVGYSQNILSQDPDLAEGVPVRNALFVVRDGVARLEADPPVTFREKWDWKDDTVDDDWVVRDPKGRNARVVQKMKVQPFRQYHVTVKVRTKEFKGRPMVRVIAGGRVLNYDYLGVKPTQEWTEHHAVFNSLENKLIRVYLGCWNGTTGTLAWKDAKIEEVGLLNVVRRKGAPLVVRREGGGALIEGKDFEPVADPRMGTVPWRGEYEVWHEPPAIRTSLPDGTRLRVSFYHVLTIHHGQVMICPSEPKTMELLREQARRLHELWGAKDYFMLHDEIRVLNWDESCTRRKLDAGEIVAENVRACAQILRDVNPGGRIYVWSDMFDPHHNAHENYYLVRGNLAGAWKGLDKDVIVAVWFLDKAEKSLDFFSSRGLRTLIAGYYDHDPEWVRGWMKVAPKYEGVEGIMYTTWIQKYADLERYAEIINEYR